ncbi:hypothetical protein ACK6E9_004618 [Escherichia coli]|uniref:hypothetical protein n=1 Tax=Escherichia coli TaxID=562 RepID=UPI000B7D9108|nr:hypothetical protein [Escherichia coli]EEV6126172.1 hypothetical protein [Escherichia coli]EEV7659029.1 hypothetical protein [Escherichia coli]EFA3683121.1 hypothetical protein [Escherichia coli]EFC0009982.1 hypothetical protein [Escherichia coli]EFD0306380.1 hypothetical protein [Escherichia coli]
MSDLSPLIQAKVQIIMAIENGQVINTRKVHNNEMIASMDTFLWIAKKAGYQVIAPDLEEIGDINSNTNS